MSEIKYINLEDDRLWEILFDEACVEGGQAERIQKELEKIAIDEKEITRNPMQEIVKKLEKKIDNKLYNPNWNAGIIASISVVESVGGING